MKPIFDIEIGATSRECRVVCDGKDITDAVAGVTVNAEHGKPTGVSLRLGSSSAVVRVKGALEVLRVSVPADPVCPTCGAHDAREVQS